MQKTIMLTCVAVAAALASFAVTPAAAQAPVSTASAAQPPATAQRSYASPEDAVKSLVAAIRAADTKALAAIIGPGAGAWITTGDAVQDAQDRKAFLAAYDQKNALEMKGSSSAILAIGADAWPFAVPIVKKGGRWVFDAKAGREELANRRVGRNELDAMQTLREIVDAQRKYASTDADGNGLADYARRLISSEGSRDGLYWPAKPGEPASPLGPLADAGAAQGYDKTPSAGVPQPYRGYRYRILTAQGKDAPGGAANYLAKDRLIGGFAVVAYPVTYGVSGIVSFLANQDGVVYEKDLGRDTASVAGGMTRYNPDKSWKRVQP